MSELLFKRAFLIHPDSRVERLSLPACTDDGGLELDMIQYAVGGYAESIPAKGPYSIFVKDEFEEGDIENLSATHLARWDTILTGPAVITGPVDVNGDTLPIQASVIQEYLRR